MNEILARQAAPKTTAEYKAAIDLLLAEMRQMNAKMAEDQIAIDRLRTETRALGARTDRKLEALLAQIAALRDGD